MHKSGTVSEKKKVDFFFVIRVNIFGKITRTIYNCWFMGRQFCY